MAGWDAPAHAAPTRELWRIVATVLAARALGVRVALSASTFGDLARPEDRALSEVARRSAELVFAEPAALAAWLDRT